LIENVKKNTRLYLVYMLLWLPADLHWCVTNTNPWYHDIAWYIKGVMIMGETRYSIPLWYLLALIVAEIIVIVFYKTGRRGNRNLRYAWSVGISLMLIGYLMESSTNNIIMLFSKHVGYRNGFFMGLGLFTTGMIIRRLYDVFKSTECFFCGLLLLVCAFFMFKHNLPFKFLFAGCGAFLASMSIGLKDHWIYAKLRNISTLVYFLHMYIIVAVTSLFSEWLQEMPVVQVWLIILTLSIMLSVAIEIARKQKTFTWLNHLVG